MLAVVVPSETVSTPPLALPRKVAVVSAPKLTSVRSSASVPLSPDTWPVNATASLSSSVPVVPAKSADCPLIPLIATVAPSAIVTGAAVLTLNNGSAAALSDPINGDDGAPSAPDELLSGVIVSGKNGETVGATG